MIGDHPHGVELILSNTCHAGANQTVGHVERRLLASLPIIDTATGSRAIPYQFTTILHHTNVGGIGYRLAWDCRNREVDHLAADRIDERIELRVSHHEPAFLIPVGRGHKNLFQIAVVGVIGPELVCLQIKTLHTTTQGTNPDVTPLILRNRPHVAVGQ